jgi:hypothetical protein
MHDAAMRTALIVALCLLGCKEKSKPVPVDPPPTPPPVARESADELKAKSGLVVTEQAGAFVVSDGAKKFQLTLPNKPTVTGDVASQGGVSVFNAQAVMPGGAVDVQFGSMTSLDGEMPREMLDMISSAPSQLATAAGGTLAKNEATKLAGRDARAFELTTSDARRLFGWYVIASSQARMYQINCVGPDNAASRTACETVAKSLTLTP